MMIMDFRKVLSRLLLVVSLFVVKDIKAQTWDKKTDMPGAREGAICFSLNGKIYWGGGTETSQTSAMSDFYEYDPATDKWKQLNNMPEERLYGISFVINGKGYIGLGKTSGSGNSAYLSSLYEYDASSDNWTKKTSLNIGTGGVGLTDSKVFVVNNKAYVLGGTTSGFGNYGTLHEYDPAADTWTEKAGYPVSHQGSNWVRLPMVFSIGNKGYVTCGEIRKKSGLGSEYSKQTFEYDPATDKWTQKADFAGDARQGGIAFVKGGKAYCGLGASRDGSFQNVFYKDVYTYDPATDKWTATTDFAGSARVRASATMVNGVGYVGGGSEWQASYKKDWYSIGTPSSVAGSSFTENTSVQLYPVPAHDIVQVQSKENFSNYMLYDISGKLVLEGVISKGRFNVQNTPAGTYILKLRSDKTQARNILVIQ